MAVPEQAILNESAGKGQLIEGQTFSLGNAQNSANSLEDKNYKFALRSLIALFFMWGFITCLNDILIPYLKGLFALNYTQVMLVQFCFFGAYFISSIPAGKLVSKIGFQKGIVTGLLIACLGCLLFYPAASYSSYNFFLGALFVLATGVTLLQVSANPFVSVLGAEKTASSRLTLSQAFNSLGTTLAPFFGSWLILSSITENDILAIQIPYLLLAGVLFCLAVIFSFINLPKLGANNVDGDQKQSEGSAWQFPKLTLGAVGIFVYVGAEVGIGSFLISFLSMDSIAGLEESQAANYIAYYFGGAMVGRFIGAAVMQKISAAKLLSFNAMCAVLLLLCVMFSTGYLAMWAILLVGLCNSIMFPTIFSLAITGLKKHTSQGSGILCLAIVGGAILPLIQGSIADAIGLQYAFVVPVLCFVYIAFYGIYCATPSDKLAANAVIPK
ncbi:sugar MFS transporter [Psychrosphaera sp. B3R10]|uniref:sugar MFS transporter n=1 Tax=unclassified Psychrosphaera TaxID=2641570 RepID=UPI001C090B65|nr:MULTISPECIES: sugar MFS transporter [unclassified Psychrosphaera]MBU2883600.1 sugar MFS transporter [Psychrosphaera sp. I2R16]MBU2989778.1 sugar MFS transporter [Psychrosphaera sp. B3R10]